MCKSYQIVGLAGEEYAATRVNKQLYANESTWFIIDSKYTKTGYEKQLLLLKITIKYNMMNKIVLTITMLFALNLFPQQAELNPQLQVAETLETNKIHYVAGKLRRNDALITVRPFRAPHHTISDVIILFVVVIKFRCVIHLLPVYLNQF